MFDAQFWKQEAGDRRAKNIINISKIRNPKSKIFSASLRLKYFIEKEQNNEKF